MVYRWSERSSDSLLAAQPEHHDAQLVGEALARCAASNGGRLAVPDVIAAARSTDSPLHPFFEWDDRKAARAYRRRQAETLIRCVVTAVPDADTPVPAFVRLGVDPSSYTPIERARLAAVQVVGADGDVTVRGVVTRREHARRLAVACRELQGWKQRYGDLEELRDFIAHLESELAALSLCQ
jgi:hypothetical protein